MIYLLIIADDFTGALDTGVQFATAGIKTKVMISQEFPGEYETITEHVLVIDAETRHLIPAAAKQVVSTITKTAVAAGIPYIYKKTDSALRGNIGSELEAVMDMAGKGYLSFVPGWPKMGRVVKDGILLIHDLPVSQSVFGKDPFEPVKNDQVKEIIAEQTKVPICEIGKGHPEGSGINIYDTIQDEELEQIVMDLKTRNRLQVMAGCAGFASVLPKALALPCSEKADYTLAKSFLVICGSVNPVTKKQLAYAEQAGFKRLYLTPQQKLETAYWNTAAGQQQLDEWSVCIKQNSRCILDSNDIGGENETLAYADSLGLTLDDVRVRIADTMGYILGQMIARGTNHTFLVTGGDTLLGLMNKSGQGSLHIVAEMESGCVLSELDFASRTYQIISKSGGFGDEKLFCTLAERIEIEGENNVANL